MRRGWFGESYRHYLAAKGYRSGMYARKYPRDIAFVAGSEYEDPEDVNSLQPAFKKVVVRTPQEERAVKKFLKKDRYANWGISPVSVPSEEKMYVQARYGAPFDVDEVDVERLRKEEKLRLKKELYARKIYGRSLQEVK